MLHVADWRDATVGPTVDIQVFYGPPQPCMERYFQWIAKAGRHVWGGMWGVPSSSVESKGRGG